MMDRPGFPGQRDVVWDVGRGSGAPTGPNSTAHGNALGMMPTYRPYKAQRAVTEKRVTVRWTLEYDGPTPGFPGRCPGLSSFGPSGQITPGSDQNLFPTRDLLRNQHFATTITVMFHVKQSIAANCLFHVKHAE